MNDTENKHCYATLAAKIQALAGEIAASDDAAPALTLDEAWSAYAPLLARRVKSATFYKAVCYYRVFCRWLRERHPDVREARGVTRRMALEFFDANCARVSAYSASCYASTLSMMWRALMVRDETVEANDPLPRAGLAGDVWNAPPVRLHARPFARRALTVDELARIYRTARGELRLLFAIGLYTGLRLGDCALLDWSEIDMENGFLSLTPRKTETTSGLRLKEAIAAPLAELFTAIPPARRHGPVMPEIAADYRRHPMIVIRRVQSVFRRCGIEMTVKTELGKRRRTLVGFHSLRHTYVSMVLNRGGNLSVVQKTVGHASPEMTDHYLHLDEVSLRKTAALLPDIRGESSPPPVDAQRLAAKLSLLDAAGLAEVKALVDRLLEPQSQGQPPCASIS